MDSTFPTLTLFVGPLPGIDRSRLEIELALLQTLFVDELGLITPLLNVQADESLPAGAYRLQLNEQRLPPIEGIKPHEFWVLYPADALTEPKFGRTWRARPAVEPNFGNAAAIVEGDDAARQLWQENGHDTRGPTEYVVFTVAAEIRKRADEFLVPALAEYYLTKLRSPYPALVDSARQQFDLATLTEALRAKLRARESIKDLRTILEDMLEARMLAP